MLVTGWLHLTVDRLDAEGDRSADQWHADLNGVSANGDQLAAVDDRDHRGPERNGSCRVKISA